jgi:15-cis-phytoene synthase
VSAVGELPELSGGSLADAYGRCRSLHREHGRTYYLATRLLPAWKRRHVHALYGFTRCCDDIVDQPAASSAGGGTAGRAAALRDWAERFRAALSGPPSDDPILLAVVHTIRVFDLDPADFTAFLRSMTMDLTVTEYDRYDDLLDYMNGSAAAIGTMMLPILGTTGHVGHRRAREPARQLGLAFQLTNFIRDVAEDLQRGRVYLPREDLDRFGVGRADLAAPEAGPAVRRLIAFEVARAREHYRAAEPGIALLAASARPCIRAAFTLYRGILEEVERAGYDVLSRRATVPNWRRAATVVRELARFPG